MCLRHLLVSWDVIESAILTEMCPCLLEMERDFGIDTLFSVGVQRDFCKLSYTSGLYQQSLYYDVNTSLIWRGKTPVSTYLLMSVK